MAWVGSLASAEPLLQHRATPDGILEDVGAYETLGSALIGSRKTQEWGRGAYCPDNQEGICGHRALSPDNPAVQLPASQQPRQGLAPPLRSALTPMDGPQCFCQTPHDTPNPTWAPVPPFLSLPC